MALRHFVLLQFEEGYMSDRLLAETRRVFREIQRQIPGVQAVAVYRNCVERDFNCDLMVQMDLENPAALPAYLEHPLHQNYAGRVMPHVRQRVSFDHVI